MGSRQSTIVYDSQFFSHNRMIVLFQVLWYSLIGTAVGYIICLVHDIQCISLQGLEFCFLSVVGRLLHLSLHLTFSLKTIILALILGIVVPLASAVPSILTMLHEIRKELRDTENSVVRRLFCLVIRLNMRLRLLNKNLFSHQLQ